MSKRKSLGVGSVSLILIFCVLCLTIFALLTLSTARSENALAKKLETSVESFYAADLAASAAYAELRGELESGVQPDFAGDFEVTYIPSEDGAITFGFASPIDDNRAVSVTGQFDGGVCEIIRWAEAPSTEWQPNLGLPVLTLE